MKVLERIVLRRVVETIARYKMFARGQRVGVAVSGGADSVCLLHVLMEMAPRWALKLSVLHLDHRLRGDESRQDAEFVRDMAARLGLTISIREVDVRQVCSESGDNLEQAARRVRREFFLGFVNEGLVDRVALGHTRSDQAETVLFRLLRGSGTTGVSGVLPVTPEGFVRPLINVDRAEVERFLQERDIAWREDSTNRDPAFARNRIRHELLPALTRDWNPALPGTLARMAVLAQDDEAYWKKEIDRLVQAHLIRKPPAVVVDVEVLVGLDRAVARRLVRKAIESARGDLRRIDFAHVEQVLALAEEREGHGRLQFPGVDVYRSFEWLRFSPRGATSARTRNYRLPLSVPGKFPVPGNDTALCLEVLEIKKQSAPANSGYNEGELDWGRIPGSLELRNWRPGDQYRPVGRASEERIKLLFQQARIPLWERGTWPIITCGERILWTRRFGPAAEYAATSQSRLILKVKEIGDFADSRNLSVRV
jgi:tRNA(Ile)-lysidine synthase